MKEREWQPGESIRVPCTTSRCSGTVKLVIKEVNRIGRPTWVQGRCDTCPGGISIGLGSAAAWRWALKDAQS